MREIEISHRELLLRVTEQISRIPSSTDHQMLTKWRAISICQHLLGRPPKSLEDACIAALEVLASEGSGVACDRALRAAGAEIRRIEGEAKSVLPSISAEKRAAVCEALDTFATAGPLTIETALRALPGVRERIQTTAKTIALPGIMHRFALVASILQDLSRPDRDRIRAGSAVLYVDEIRDAIPDTWGINGLVDDDYALRVVLEELSDNQGASFLHWSEKIASLWDELPFLQGVNLQRSANPISVTWLDRVNSYVSYAHVMGSENTPLVLLQPSVACSPLHAIVSLLGLLVLDAVTSSQSKALTLRNGQTYEVDGCFVGFEGTAGPMPGWLTLRLRDGIVYQPPALADRMIPVDGRRLSSGREFSSRPATTCTDPMQRFFDWDVAIGPASISSRLVLVASRRRALDLLEGVQSNGVRLLDHGLVRFVNAVPDEIETHSTLILVVPSLSTARILLDRGLQVQAVLVDGYERLHRGRHELPFLMNRASAPPIINWSASGYYPLSPPTWLPPHKRLEVCSDDLASILELDDPDSDATRSSLWEAATGMLVHTHITPATEREVAIIEAIDAYVRAVRSSESLPEYWQYHLNALARTLRLLVASTPAEWSEIRRAATSWSEATTTKWSTLRTSGLSALAGLRELEARVMTLLQDVPDVVNSRATALQVVLSNPTLREEQRYIVCDRPEQSRAVASLIRAIGLRHIEPVLLRDLAVCCSCTVAGWVSSSFARRLWAHTPKSLMVLVAEADRLRWERMAGFKAPAVGQSLLTAIESYNPRPPYSSPAQIPDPDEQSWDITESTWDGGGAVPCVFLWVAEEPEAKVLARDSRVIVEEGDLINERVAARLQPDDRVILGVGTSRWSPAEEFTGAVVNAVEASHPKLVEAAKEWRRALREMRDKRRLTTAQLRAELAAAGIERESQTIEGWIDLHRASPIAPRGLGGELSSLWPLIGQLSAHSLEDVISACMRLRAVRASAGRAILQLWKGRTVDFGIEEVWLDELVDRLRQEVHVYEVEAVTIGEVPPAMLGWWIPSTLAGRFESETSLITPAVDSRDIDGDEDPQHDTCVRGCRRVDRSSTETI